MPLALAYFHGASLTPVVTKKLHWKGKEFIAKVPVLKLQSVFGHFDLT